jgi:chemotaxis response regulator CheB
LVNAPPHFQIGGGATNFQAKNKPEDHLSVVCFGASAGGFEAYCKILSLLPADTGMAYIIVHHQAADGKSLLVEILPRVTKMPVVLVTDGENVKANHVYVVPAGMQVTMAGDAFRLSPLVKPPRLAQEHFHLSAIACERSAKTGDRGHPLRIRFRRGGGT